MPNKVIFSRIQNRRGPLENLPQPLRPGEIALTSDVRRLWIGNEDIAPFGIRTLTPAIPILGTSPIQISLTQRIVSVLFDSDLTQLEYDQLVALFSRENNNLFPPFIAPSKNILITTQDESDYDNSAGNGTFSGGSGYRVNDVITLNNGAAIRVDDISGADPTGPVTEFTVQYRGGEAIDGVLIAQQSVFPVGGSGFSLTPQTNNTTSAPSPDKATFFNASEQVLWDGKRSVFIGLRVPELEFAAEKAQVSVDDLFLDGDQTEANYIGRFDGGAGYSVNDVITLSNGATITVDAVGVSDTVTEFSITTIGDSFTFGDDLSQSSVSPGGGTGFEISPGLGNVLQLQLENIVANIISSPLLRTTQTASVHYNGSTGNGTFTGGSGYTVGDVITLSNGATITVTSENSGVVDGFTVNTSGSTIQIVFDTFSTLAQSSVVPIGGTGFILEPNVNNLSPINVTSIKIANKEFAPDWQGPVTSAKIKNFVNPFLNSVASGNVSKLINMVASSSLLLDMDPPQTEANYNGATGNGTFTDGINYAISDVITLSNGATIEVTNVSSGAVTEFDIVSQGGSVITNFPLTAISVVDSVGDPATGSGFTITPNDDNLVLVVSDESLNLVTTVSNIEIGVVDIFDETPFPVDLVFEQFGDLEVVLDNASASNSPTGIKFPASQSDSVFIEYTLRNAQYGATGNMRVSLFGTAVSVNDQRNAQTTLGGDITLSADYIGAGQQIRVLYTNTLSPATNDIVLRMIVRRWLSA